MKGAEVPKRSYLSGAGSTRATPQSEAIPGRESEMETNYAGGVTFTVEPMDRLRRFLILGSEGGSYYVSERNLTKDNAAALRTVLDELGTAAVDEIVAISDQGRAPRNDVALYALAMACGHKDDEVKRAALAALPKVARTATHLFQFLGFVEEFRGWGRSLKRAVGEWYTDKPVEKAAFQAVKYRQREGYTHADALRLAKPSGTIEYGHRVLFEWITKDVNLEQAAGNVAEQTGLGYGDVIERLGIVQAYERAQASPSPAETARLIRAYDGMLPREALLTEHVSSKEVQEALLEAGMPMTALIRNLGNLTRHGVIGPMSSTAQLVADQITDEAALKRARVHPITILNAMLTYQAGQGFRGSNTWQPVREVVDALDAAFYKAFANIEATGKRHMLALDVSSSMNVYRCNGMEQMTARMGSAAMALITANQGDPFMTFAFATEFVPVEFSPRERLDDVVRKVSSLPFGGTDCALPMIAADKWELEVDTFVVYTDNETWAGQIQPSQALERYRQKTGIPAKLIVVGMSATQFTIADPADAGMMDVAGFDSAAPALMADFSAGRL